MDAQIIVDTSVVTTAQDDATIGQQQYYSFVWEACGKNHACNISPFMQQDSSLAAEERRTEGKHHCYMEWLLFVLFKTVYIACQMKRSNLNFSNMIIANTSVLHPVQDGATRSGKCSNVLIIAVFVIPWPWKKVSPDPVDDVMPSADDSDFADSWLYHKVIMRTSLMNLQQVPCIKSTELKEVLMSRYLTAPLLFSFFLIRHHTYLKVMQTLSSYHYYVLDHLETTSTQDLVWDVYLPDCYYSVKCKVSAFAFLWLCFSGLRVYNNYEICLSVLEICWVVKICLKITPGAKFTDCWFIYKKKEDYSA